MIDLFLQFDISLYSVLLLCGVLFTMHMQKATESYSGKFFRWLVSVNIYMLIFEIVSWQFDGLPGQFNWYANYISNWLFGWSTPIITCVWASYIDYQMFGSVDRLRKRWFYIYPVVANTILFIINFFSPIVFSVSPDNVYAREPFMWMIIVINTATLFYICWMGYQNRHTIQREIGFVLIMFVAFPAVAAAIQVMVYGAFILWPMMAVTLVITYIFLETVSSSKDYLTGVYSRNRVDQYIDLLLAQGKSLV